MKISTADVLDFLNSELGRHGAEVISVVDLAALSAVERILLEGRLADVEVARAVAWVASLTPYADRGAFRAAFGEPAAELLDEILPLAALKLPPRHLGGLGRMNIRGTWAKATARSERTVRITSLALLAGEALKVCEPYERSLLREYIGTALTNAPDDATRGALNEIYGKLEPLPPTGNARAADSEPQPFLISISVDIVGSTQAKRRLRDLAGEASWRAALYRGFYANFLAAEDRLYRALFAADIGGVGPPLDWQRLFVVKGIGDELWLIYDAKARDGVDGDALLRQVAVRLFSAALELSRSRIECSGTGEDLGPTFDPAAQETQRSDWMSLPFKVTIDLIADAVEISGQRLDYLADRAMDYLKPAGEEDGLLPSAPFGADHADILRRLNAGHFELAGGHRVRESFRTDYLGPDVDRFFRLTGSALPGLLIVGDDLMSRLSFDVRKRIAPDVDLLQFTFPVDVTDADSLVAGLGPVLRWRRSVPARKMKGLDKDYPVNHLVTATALRSLLDECERNPLLMQTIDVLPSAMLRPASTEWDEEIWGIAS